jgi:hypothetical protein
MTVLMVAVGTTRARAVCGYADYLADRGVETALITVDAAAWQQEGLNPAVRLLLLEKAERKHPLARLGRLVKSVSGALYTKLYAKLYKIVRPYILWRVARGTVARDVDWSSVGQLVVCDSHAIPIAWHLARKHPGVAVGFELDRTQFAQLESHGAATPATTSMEDVHA